MVNRTRTIKIKAAQQHDDMLLETKITLMDREYTCIYKQGKVNLLIFTSFIGQFVHPVGREGVKGGGWGYQQK